MIVLMTVTLPCHCTPLGCQVAALYTSVANFLFYHNRTTCSNLILYIQYLELKPFFGGESSRLLRADCPTGGLGDMENTFLR